MSNRPNQAAKDKGNGSYCCECGEGPYLWKLFLKCINCNHTLCQACPQVYIKPEKPRATQQHGVVGSRNKRMRQAPNSRSLLTPSPSLAPTTATDFEDGIDRLGAYLPTAPDFQPIDTGIPLPSGGGNLWDVENMWACCRCGHGGALIATTPSCLDCGHPRCSSCSVIEP